MAELVSKSLSEAANHIFSPTPVSSNHQQHRLFLSPDKSNSAIDFSCASAFPYLSLKSSSSISRFYGRRRLLLPCATPPQSAPQMMSIGVRKAQRWWEKGLQPNMKEVIGAQDLVDSLLNAGDKLVVVDFFSPACGGCKALHPKICQLAEMNPDVQFLQVNFEQHKSMCYTLNVHVLPFFRFYRGSHGRVCSFSCTNATMKKFKDALAKYGADCCSLGPTKGFEEKELLALAANRELSFNYTPREAIPEQEEIQTELPVEVSPHPNSGLPLPLPRSSSFDVVQSIQDQNRPLLSTTGRS